MWQSSKPLCQGWTIGPQFRFVNKEQGMRGQLHWIGGVKCRTRSRTEKWSFNTEAEELGDEHGMLETARVEPLGAKDWLLCEDFCILLYVASNHRLKVTPSLTSLLVSSSDYYLDLLWGELSNLIQTKQILRQLCCLHHPAHPRIMIIVELFCLFLIFLVL